MKHSIFGLVCFCSENYQKYSCAFVPIRGSFSCAVFSAVKNHENCVVAGRLGL